MRAAASRRARNYYRLLIWGAPPLRAAPLASGAQPRALFHPAAARRVDECANARRFYPLFLRRGLPSSLSLPPAGVCARCGRARPATLSLPLVGSATLRPRHASPRAYDYAPTADVPRRYRAADVSASLPLKKSPVQIEYVCTRF